MEIKITIERDEILEVIKKYVLETFPINLDNKEFEVGEMYGIYNVTIYDKIKDEKNRLKRR